MAPAQRLNHRLHWRQLFMLPLCLLTACASLMDAVDGNSYEMQRSALLAYESGADARAEALYQGLARASPNDPEIWLRLGNLYARSNRPDNAADAYLRGLVLAPSDSRMWYNLGIIRQRQAHAAFIQTHQLVTKDDELSAKAEVLIKRLAPLPVSATTLEHSGNSAVSAIGKNDAPK